MDLPGILKGAVAILTPLATLVGTLVAFIGRKPRLRSDIKENLALMSELRKEPLFEHGGLTSGWLAGRIVLDVARLTGQSLGPQKKPIPWGSVIFAAVLALAGSVATYLIDRDGFVWFSVFPASIAFLLLISILGMLTNRQVVSDPSLPDGATEIRSGTTDEQIASRVQLEASGADTSMFELDGQVGVALEFVTLLGKGAFEQALNLAEPNWLLCRVQARLWNTHLEGSLDLEELAPLAQSLAERRQPENVWEDFAQAEGNQFADAWHGLNERTLGAASRRRRISRDFDLVVLTPLGSSEHGYFVTSATVLPGAFSLLMRATDSGWRVSNHIGVAPPSPGWPPTWWSPADDAFAALTDLGDPEGPR